jgi:hypothetical protein
MKYIFFSMRRICSIRNLPELRRNMLPPSPGQLYVCENLPSHLCIHWIGCDVKRGQNYLNSWNMITERDACYAKHVKLSLCPTLRTTTNIFSFKSTSVLDVCEWSVQPCYRFTPLNKGSLCFLRQSGLSGEDIYLAVARNQTKIRPWSRP